jgi:uncharacterized protein with von Willebrand factor type A (vWA) domain
MSKQETGALAGVDYSSPIVKYRGSRVAELTRIISHSRQLYIDPLIAIDTYYTLYLPAPVLRESSGVESLGIMQSILGTTSGIKLRAKTILDSFMSSIAAAIILSKIYTSRDSLEQGLKPHGGQRGDSRVISEDLLADVLSDVEEISRIRSALEGSEPGTISVESMEDYALDLIKLAKDADVKPLLNALTSIREYGFSKSRRDIRSKRGEKRGYEIGVDFERIVPRDVFLDDELFLFKLVQGRLLLYSKYIVESSGPIYLLVDKSGSMEGEKMLWAKALALALYTKVLREKRPFYVRFFDSQPHRLHYIGRTPDSRSAVRLFEYIAKMKSAGGTDITRAVVTALMDIQVHGVKESSIVLVTDGIDRVIERPIREGLKKTSSSLLVVMIKGENDSLKVLAKEYFSVVKLSNDEVLRVVKSID